MYSFLLLGKASIQKNPRGQFLWCFFCYLEKKSIGNPREYILYPINRFLFCHLLHSSQLPLFLRLRNFENQVGRDALGEDQDDQDVDQDDRNDRDDRTDRDDRNDRDVRNDCDDYDDD